MGGPRGPPGGPPTSLSPDSENSDRVGGKLVAGSKGAEGSVQGWRSLGGVTPFEAHGGFEDHYSECRDLGGSHPGPSSRLPLTSPKDQLVAVEVRSPSRKEATAATSAVKS